MISWVSSTRHISGFLSWPSYTMACVGDSKDTGNTTPTVWAPHRLRRRKPPGVAGVQLPRGGDRHTRSPSHPATSAAGMPRTARLPSSSHGRTPGLSLGGLRGGRSRACGDPGTAGEGAQPHSRFLAPGPPQPGGVLWPLSYTKARSLCRKKSIRVRCTTDARGGRRAQGQPCLRHEALPRPGSPAANLAPCPPHTPPLPPGARVEVGDLGCVARRPRAAGSRARRRHVLAPRQGADGLREGPGPGGALLARPRASRPMIFGKKSANGQSGVYFQSANNDFFSSGKKAVSARTLGWVLSRGSARWCEALGALTPAPSPAPPPGAPARPPSPPPASPKEEEKRPLGEGREAGAASRRFRAENSSKGRAAHSAVPASPHPLEILWK